MGERALRVTNRDRSAGAAGADPESSGPGLNGRHRRANCAIQIAFAIGVPILVSPWAGTAFVVFWAIAFIGAHLYITINPLGHSMPMLGIIRSFLTGLCFAALPTMVMVCHWTDEAGMPSMPWQVPMVLLLYLALASLTVVEGNRRGWRTGPAIAGFMQVMALLATGDVLIAVIFFVATATLLSLGQQVRRSQQLAHAGRLVAEAEAVRVREEAMIDALTGVMNRRGITREIERAVRGPAIFVMFDANRFKSINDTAGHAVGDQVLTDIASELTARLGPTWCLGRLGGDEFLAVSSSAKAVPSGVEDPVHCKIARQGQTRILEVGLSAGVVHTPEASSTDYVLSRASYAMREAKRRDTGIAYFGGRLQRRFERGLEVAAVLSGDAPGKIHPVAQAIVCDGSIVGCELLARWTRHDGSDVSPVEFLPLLRDNGLVPELNRQMIEAGVAFAARFNNRVAAPFVSVNVSAPHLATAEIVDEIAAALARHRVSPSRLMIELTESDALWRGHWQASARRLQDMGVMLAIDDFGAGYSTIERVATVPISHLKFDRTFATRVSGPFGEVLRGIVRFADASGIGVIAEGIETTDQQLAMAAVGIRRLQGFLFGRPAPLDDIERAIIRQESAPVDLRNVGAPPAPVIDLVE